MNGIELIANERLEQLNKHNCSFEHDSEHISEELKWAAAYLLTKDENLFPDWDFKYFMKFKEKEGIEALKVAGALIAAEIDRLLYAEGKLSHE
jgi:hypothetical protein